MYAVAKNSYLDNNTNETTVRFTNNSHKAYLPVKGNFAELLQLGNGFRFVFDDGETTDIEEAETEVEDTIYDLHGRKLSEITEPGFYIVNGKKIFVKWFFAIGELFSDWSRVVLPPLSHFVAAPLGQGSS